MRILATDDDPIILELLSQFLIAVGPHEVVTANSGAEALALLGEETTAPFDCFLNDIQMPQMDGIELTRRIKKIPTYAAAPIVMLTAMSEIRGSKARQTGRPPKVPQQLQASASPMLPRWHLPNYALHHREILLRQSQQPR